MYKSKIKDIINNPNDLETVLAIVGDVLLYSKTKQYGKLHEIEEACMQMDSLPPITEETAHAFLRGVLATLRIVSYNLLEEAENDK